VSAVRARGLRAGRRRPAPRRARASAGSAAGPGRTRGSPMSEASARDSRRLARPSPQRLREPTIGFERVAKLLVPGRVVGTREQQRVAVVSGAVRPVLDEAQADLLVVGIV